VVIELLIKGGNDWVVRYTARPLKPCQGLFLTTLILPRGHENPRRTRKNCHSEGSPEESRIEILNQVDFALLRLASRQDDRSVFICGFFERVLSWYLLFTTLCSLWFVGVHLCSPVVTLFFSC
jgi:hypothetical protein